MKLEGKEKKDDFGGKYEVEEEGGWRLAIVCGGSRS